MRHASALHLGRDAINGVVGRKDGAFLPCHQVRQVVAGKVGSSFRLLQLVVGLRTARNPIVGEAAKGVGNLRPTDVDGFSEQVRAAGVKRFDGGARGLTDLGCAVELAPLTH